MFGDAITQWFSSLPVWLFVALFFVAAILYSVGINVARSHGKPWLALSMFGVLAMWQYMNMQIAAMGNESSSSGLITTVVACVLIFAAIAWSNKKMPITREDITQED